MVAVFKFQQGTGSWIIDHTNACNQFNLISIVLINIRISR